MPNATDKSRTSVNDRRVTGNDRIILFHASPLSSPVASPVTVIRQEGSCIHYLGADNGGILLEGSTRLQFGTNLIEKRRCFVLRIWGRITSAYPSPPRGRGQGEGAENTVVILPQILNALNYLKARSG
jgi:hypothetical protein